MLYIILSAFVLRLAFSQVQAQDRFLELPRNETRGTESSVSENTTVIAPAANTTVSEPVSQPPLPPAVSEQNTTAPLFPPRATEQQQTTQKVPLQPQTNLATGAELPESVTARLNLVKVCPELSEACKVPNTTVASIADLQSSLACMLEVDISAVEPGPCLEAMKNLQGITESFGEEAPESMEMSLERTSYNDDEEMLFPMENPPFVTSRTVRVPLMPPCHICKRRHRTRRIIPIKRPDSFKMSFPPFFIPREPIGQQFGPLMSSLTRLLFHDDYAMDVPLQPSYFRMYLFLPKRSPMAPEPEKDVIPEQFAAPISSEEMYTVEYAEEEQNITDESESEIMNATEVEQQQQQQPPMEVPPTEAFIVEQPPIPRYPPMEVPPTEVQAIPRYPPVEVPPTEAQPPRYPPVEVPVEQTSGTQAYEIEAQNRTAQQTSQSSQQPAETAAYRSGN